MKDTYINNNYFETVYESPEKKIFGLSPLIDDKYHLVWTPSGNEDGNNILMWPKEIVSLMIDNLKLDKIK